MVRIGEHVWKHRKKPKSRNRSAAHKNVRLAVTDRNDRREAIGTVQRIVLLRGILSARRAEKELAQRERRQRVFQEPREQRTDVAETARCRKMRNGKTARLLEDGSGLSAVHCAEENDQKWRKMRP